MALPQSNESKRCRRNAKQCRPRSDCSDLGLHCLSKPICLKTLRIIMVIVWSWGNNTIFLTCAVKLTVNQQTYKSGCWPGKHTCHIFQTHTMRSGPIYHEILKSNQGDFSGGFFAVKYHNFQCEQVNCHYFKLLLKIYYQHVYCKYSICSNSNTVKT